MRKLHNYNLVLVWMLMWCSCGQMENPDSKHKKSLLNSFKLADGFNIDIIAIEPAIADPVDMMIDEFGRMYVVEMPGYPLDLSGGGKVKLFQDANGDGQYDKISTFAENLTLPNGIMRWKEGIIVTDAPNILYFVDTDGDGVSDTRDTIVTGFARGNPQHKVNNPEYGIDNWIYLANEPASIATIYSQFSDLGSPIAYHKSANSYALPVNGNGLRVRIKPDQELLELTSSRTQFGHTFDSWGHTFTGNNTTHIRQEMIAGKYVRRNPDLKLTSTTVGISNYGSPADVYPITENPEHQIFTAVGVFTSACGITTYQGGLFPEPFDKVVFIAEPVSNLVHASVLVDDGIGFKVNRLFNESEFLASKDPWFRPVNHYIGPDGNLYVVDYYRRVIEHPEWMAEEVSDPEYLYAGKGMGRIYRISPQNNGVEIGFSKPWPGEVDNSTLVQNLSDPNSWWRITSQRLLIDRNAKEESQKLHQIVSDENYDEYGRLHAAWTLEGMGELTSQDIFSLIASGEPGLRENGIILSEVFIGKNRDVESALLGMGDENDIRVLYQLLCTLGWFASNDAETIRQSILFEHLNNPWMQNAYLSSVSPNYHGVLYRLIDNYNQYPDNYNSFIERLIPMYSAKASDENIKKLINRAVTSPDGWSVAVLDGLSRSDYLKGKWKIYGSEVNRLLNIIMNSEVDMKFRRSSFNVISNLGLRYKGNVPKKLTNFVGLFSNKDSIEEDRLIALQLMKLIGINDHRVMLYELLKPGESLEVQKKILEVLFTFESEVVTSHLVDHWNNLSPQIRQYSIQMFLKDEDNIPQLVEALESGTIKPSEINFYQSIHMRMVRDEDLRKRARTMFNIESMDEGRKEAISKYEKALEGDTDLINGKKVFGKNCSRCHQIGGKDGTDFGPDLGSMRNRTGQAILRDILDPGLSIADGYDFWEIELTGGNKVRGIIASETPSSIVLHENEMKTIVLSRDQIAGMNSMSLSVMPVGFENMITENEMRDLIFFMRSEK